MTGLNLIHFLDFYYMFFFLANTLRRLGQYLAVARLVAASRGRWPKLLNLVSGHRAIFLTWTTLLPGLLALALSLLQLVASRWLWPEAGKPPDGLSLGRLLDHWPALFAVVPLGLAMFALDLFSLLAVGSWQREELEKHFDQAEYWLGSHSAHVVRIFTLGFINPRGMVHTEVRKALIELSRMLNYTLWWVSLQVGIRLAFGLSLWLTWVVTLP
jgi:hypothetical protein